MGTYHAVPLLMLACLPALAGWAPAPEPLQPWRQVAPAAGRVAERAACVRMPKTRRPPSGSRHLVNRLVVCLPLLPMSSSRWSCLHSVRYSQPLPVGARA